MCRYKKVSSGCEDTRKSVADVRIQECSECEDTRKSVADVRIQECSDVRIQESL